MRQRFFVLAALWLLPSAAAQAPEPGNILVLFADDLGVDKIGCYQPGTTPPPPSTPTIDALAANGIRFEHAYSNPLCSPTRACLQTGRYGFRTGIGTNVRSNDPANPVGPLLPEEILLPEMLDLGGSGFAHAAFGKWHLGFHKNLGVGGDPLNPGWAHFSGIKANFNTRTVPPEHYEYWLRTVDGISTPTTHYAPADNVDEALGWIAQQSNQPWLCFIAFNSAHTPIQRPPGSSLPNPTPQPGEEWWPYHHAMVEAMDAEIQRLLSGIGAIDPQVLALTTIFFLADNGTGTAPSGLQQVVFPPFDPTRSKGTVFEGGVHVPLVVSGHRVSEPGRTSEALVGTVDLFATIAGLAGVDLSQPGVIPPGHTVDSVSFLPVIEDSTAPSQRATVFSEWFPVNHPSAGPLGPADRCIRDKRYKLLRLSTVAPPHHVQFFDLWNDPFEYDNLLQHASGLTRKEEAALQALELAMDDLLASP